MNIAKQINDKTPDYLFSLETFVKKTLNFRLDIKCFAIYAHESEAYILAPPIPFKEVYLISNSSNIGPYNQKLNAKNQIKILNDIPLENGVYYFPNSEIYNRYSPILDSTLVITKRKNIEFNDSMLEILGNSKFVLFLKMRDFSINAEEVKLFADINSFVSDIYVVGSILGAMNELNQLNIQNNPICSTNYLWTELSLSNYWLQLIEHQLNKGINNWQFVINEIHLKLIQGRRNETIPFFIILINILIKNCLKEMYSSPDHEIAYIKLHSLSLIAKYNLSNLLLDYITNANITEFLATTICEMINEHTKNFLLLYETKHKITAVNASTNEDLFNFINSFLECHINRLLNNESIRNGYTQLDSVTIDANSFQEAIEKLTIILSTQPIKENYEEYNINQLFENQFIAIPKPETVRRHLYSLIPTELVTVPIVFSFAGKMLVGRKIAIKMHILKFSNNIEKAKLVLVLMHEISHSKRLLFANHNRYWPKTPEEFLKEAGLFLDKHIYGEYVNEPTCRLSSIDEEIADAILNVRPLTEAQANKLFTSNNNKEFGQQLTDDDYDEEEYLCDGMRQRKI